MAENRYVPYQKSWPLLEIYELLRIIFLREPLRNVRGKIAYNKIWKKADAVQIRWKIINACMMFPFTMVVGFLIGMDKNFPLGGGKITEIEVIHL